MPTAPPFNSVLCLGVSTVTTRLSVTDSFSLAFRQRVRNPSMSHTSIHHECTLSACANGTQDTPASIATLLVWPYLTAYRCSGHDHPGYVRHSGTVDVTSLYQRIHSVSSEPWFKQQKRTSLFLTRRPSLHITAEIASPSTL